MQFCEWSKYKQTHRVLSPNINHCAWGMHHTLRASSSSLADEHNIYFNQLVIPVDWCPLITGLGGKNAGCFILVH